MAFANFHYSDMQMISTELRSFPFPVTLNLVIKLYYPLTGRRADTYGNFLM